MDVSIYTYTQYHTILFVILNILIPNIAPLQNKIVCYAKQILLKIQHYAL